MLTDKCNELESTVILSEGVFDNRNLVVRVGISNYHYTQFTGTVLKLIKINHNAVSSV